MNITIDIGNTRTKIGVFDRDRLMDKVVMDGFDGVKVFEVATNHDAKNIIFSSVSTVIDDAILAKFQHQFQTVIQLTADTPLPIENRYATPLTLGKDRLAAVVGAYALHGDEACLVIDAGTCITYDILAPGGKFIGGNISPGVELRLKAMHHFTQRLPLPESRIVDSEWGNSTEKALVNGAILGVIFEMDGFIGRAKEEYGSLNTILTGGDANIFGKTLKNEIFANSNLVLIGLNKILNYNVENSK